MKNKIIYILIIAEVLGNLLFAGWVFFKFNQHEKVINAQGTELQAEAAAWQTLLANLAETERANFLKAVNDRLNPTK